MKFNYIRLYADDEGQSHFEDVDVSLLPVELLPSFSPIFLSSFNKATQFAFYGAPGHWASDWHPSEARNLFVVISGRWEIKASDGEVRTCGPRDTLLVEDTRGVGHQSRVLGDEESLALLVQLESR